MKSCPKCNGVINGVGDCVDCGTCVICWPNKCDCQQVPFWVFPYWLGQKWYEGEEGGRDISLLMLV